MLTDTIAAIATPIGEGGIGIVRVSGQEAFKIASRVFKQVKKGISWCKENESHKFYYGYIVEPETGIVIDQVLLGVMRSPHSYTGEDVVEFNCHGGVLPVKKTLELVLIQGARLAEPGEFTKRAFLNGRLDLTQAEAVLDVIRAKTEESLKLAASHLKGELARTINQLMDRLLGLLALIEVNIDFPEENLANFSPAEAVELIQEILAKVNDLIATADHGKIYREGMRIVIVGCPNVGKSSLLNVLLQEKRAIVTDLPGTTRDIIEESVNINGIPVRLVDTAGLRAPENIVEEEGIARTHALIQQADLILFMLASDTGLEVDLQEIFDLVKDKKGIILVNKIDLVPGDLLVSRLKEKIKDKPIMKLSVKNKIGLRELKDKITEIVLNGQVKMTVPLWVSNVRHKNALIRARQSLEDSLTGLENNVPEDLLAIDLKNAWEALGEITGTAVSEDIINRIFADFCVGK